MKSAETVVLTSNLELLVMSALKGRMELFGFSGTDISNVQKEDIIMVMQGLCAEDVAEINDNKLQLHSPYDEIVSDICKAQNVIIIRKTDNSKPVICAYCGENTVIAESTGRKPGEIRLISSPEEGITGFLKNNGYLPGTDDFGKSMTDEQEKTDVLYNEPTEQFLSIEAVDAKLGLSKGHMSVKKGDLFYIIEADGECVRYSDNTLKDKINCLLINGEVI